MPRTPHRAPGPPESVAPAGWLRYGHGPPGGRASREPGDRHHPPWTGRQVFTRAGVPPSRLRDLGLTRSADGHQRPNPRSFAALYLLGRPCARRSGARWHCDNISAAPWSAPIARNQTSPARDCSASAGPVPPGPVRRRSEDRWRSAVLRGFARTRRCPGRSKRRAARAAAVLAGWRAAGRASTGCPGDG